MPKRKLSERQAMEDLAMKELKTLLQKAKKAYDRAQEAENAVFSALADMRIDLDAPTRAENADNFGEAVSCFLQYGEYSLAELLSEIGDQHSREDRVTD